MALKNLKEELKQETELGSETLNLFETCGMPLSEHFGFPGAVLASYITLRNAIDNYDFKGAEQRC